MLVIQPRRIDLNIYEDEKATKKTQTPNIIIPTEDVQPDTEAV